MVACACNSSTEEADTGRCLGPAGCLSVSFRCNGRLCLKTLGRKWLRKAIQRCPLASICMCTHVYIQKGESVLCPVPVSTFISIALRTNIWSLQMCLLTPVWLSLAIGSGELRAGLGFLGSSQPCLLSLHLESSPSGLAGAILKWGERGYSSPPPWKLESAELCKKGAKIFPPWQWSILK